MTAENEELQHWVAHQLQCAPDKLTWQPIQGDASFRQYWRCAFDGKAYIAAFAPPATEKNHAFVVIANALRDAAVVAPEIFAVDYQRGFILQGDVGQYDLQSQLTAQTVDRLYQQAMAQIAQMQSIKTDAIGLYDEAALQLELSYFQTWFLEALLDYHCDADENALLTIFFRQLVQAANAQPQAFVHRDYHCRNILCQENGALATIDFQDALIGPCTYDLVSLLRDCYVVWPDAQVQAWQEQFRQRHWPSISAAEFTRYFNLMGLQRHIKVLGVFARLSVRDNKPRYLQDLATVFRYVHSVAKQQSEGQAFASWLEEKILPLAQKTSWGATL